MASTLEELAGDCVFQLNSLLWMLHPDTTLTHSVKPVLRQAGFVLVKINPEIALSPGILAQVADANMADKVQRSACPEVVIHHAVKRRVALIECKRSSFGAGSTNAAQARALLLGAGTPSETLAGFALDGDCRVIYCVAEPDADRMRNGLFEICGELIDVSLSVGKHHAGEFSVSGNEVSLRFDTGGRDFMNLKTSSKPFLIADGIDDPRPIYFVPIDVDADATDRYGRRTLFERIRNSVAMRVATAKSSDTVQIPFGEVANESTFGLFDHLANRNSRKKWNGIFIEIFKSIGRHLQRNNLAPFAWNSEAKSWSRQHYDRDERDRVLKELWKLAAPYDDVFTYRELPGISDEGDSAGNSHD